MVEREWRTEDISVRLFVRTHGGGDIYQVGDLLFLGKPDRYYIHQVTYNYSTCCENETSTNQSTLNEDT